jgi:hypothetical protein
MMSVSDYVCDKPTSFLDRMLVAGAGPAPIFDTVTADFLLEGHRNLKALVARGGLLECASLGRHLPWIYRLTFLVRGLRRGDNGQITSHSRHIVALRFLPDYLRHANRFAMLRLVEPATRAWHPNISDAGAVCVEIYPGESLVEICHSLHDLFRWRLRQYDERDALNREACAWGRQHVHVPIDDRPLFGERLDVRWQASERPMSSRRNTSSEH